MTPAESSPSAPLTKQGDDDVSPMRYLGRVEATNCAASAARSELDLQQNDGVHREQNGEQDGGAVEVALDHRAAAE